MCSLHDAVEDNLQTALQPTVTYLGEEKITNKHVSQN